jgi:predicted small secreted protein
MKAFTVFVGIFALLALSACNTIQGAGRDLQRAGEELEEVVDG